MQIAYQGFTGSDKVERLAGVELVRLESAASDIVNSHLTIEAYRDTSGVQLYDARLDLVTKNFDLIPVQRGSNSDVSVAIHEAFDNAMRLLKRRREPSI
ncbi:hypothetical protein [Caballeronia sp. BR00000012568055]|uniref:hypothetical protein n=1 Tax=Caballeronia sp. BR00000012568055 TaxID=2918761 RepID=UPI0023F981A9|nr:hypothetical protein [Caballeronia sp. BR00000012568055]